MTYAAELQLLGTVIVVQCLVIVFALALALIAILEMRRMRLIAAARDPLWNASEDDALVPGMRGLIARLRKAGAL